MARGSTVELLVPRYLNTMGARNAGWPLLSAIRISDITLTPVAFADPPLLTAVGVHEPYALRAIIEIATDAGLTGLGETYGDDHHLAALRAAARAVKGADVYHTEDIYRRVAAIMAKAQGGTIASGLAGDS